MAISVFKGLDRAGLSRRAGSFLDSIYIMKAEIESNQIVVTDPLNREYHRTPPIPELVNYAVQSIQCLRSAQSGKLIVTLGGFYVGTGGQQALVVSTDYDIKQPISHEEYEAGKR